MYSYIDICNLLKIQALFLYSVNIFKFSQYLERLILVNIFNSVKLELYNWPVFQMISLLEILWNDFSFRILWKWVKYENLSISYYTVHTKKKLQKSESLFMRNLNNYRIFLCCCERNFRITRNRVSLFGTENVTFQNYANGGGGEVESRNGVLVASHRFQICFFQIKFSKRSKRIFQLSLFIVGFQKTE